MIKIYTTLAIYLGMNMFCQSQNTYTYEVPQELNDGWETASFINSDNIRRLFQQLEHEPHDIHSILVFHDSKLVIEEYYNGYSRDKTHDQRSVTKSIRSILLGIAIDQGFISSVHDPISNYLKSHAPKKNLDDPKNEITIQHLLTMSSGLDCNDWDRKSKGQEDKVHKKKDWIQYTLDLPMIHKAGEVSTYCSMGTVLLAEIISQASGMSLQAFAKQYLFDPLRITNVSWGHTEEKEVIPSGKRLHMTSRDMGKIGQLILNEGKWLGKQVVSNQWIREATSTKTNITGVPYGYLWWNLSFPNQNKIQVAKTATGNGGQYIMVFDELELVVIFTGGAYNSEKDKIPFAIVKDVLLPTFSN